MIPTSQSLILLALLFSTVGCGEKSIQYYVDNPKETAVVLAECSKKGKEVLKEQNCLNAIKGNAQVVTEKMRANDLREAAEIEKWSKQNEKNR